MDAIEASLSMKWEKFRNLPENETHRATDSIRRIGKVLNKQAYEWKEVEVRMILKVLNDTITNLEAGFASPKEKVDA